MIGLAEIYKALRSVVGEKYVVTEFDGPAGYYRQGVSGDEVPPYALVSPGTVEEVSGVVKICNEHKMSLTIRGGGTGVSGGADSTIHGIALSVARLNRIIEISRTERIAIVEAGVITQVFREAVLKQGLSFPQNPGSSGSCFIGGNIAVSSGSPKSLKYGPARNHVLNMEVVLSSGQIMWTGKNVTKNATGYNLTQLLAGSEGTLGIITKLVLQLVEPEEEILVMANFPTIADLFDCVDQLFIRRISPSSMEFVDRSGYEIVSEYLKSHIVANSPGGGLLWLEFSGNTKEGLIDELGEVSELLGKYTDEEVLVAESSGQIRHLWSFREKIGEAVMHCSSFSDIDIVVPRGKIREMYNAIVSIAGSYGFRYAVVGHIGNGNFHVNILNEDAVPEAQWNVIRDRGIREIFVMAVRLGGTISGEHGIGRTQRPYLDLAIPEFQISLMKDIKRIFDPNDILNPGKIF